ncbi:MAG TPA: lytic transglycosylase domain-containing protein [Rhodopila sp.]|nr:lytic transglycosylase domain-containing protein [Rhodopila sp.]
MLSLDETRADEAAFATPHGKHDSGVILPRPLSSSDVSLLSRIFSLQTRGDIADAVHSTAALGSPLLKGTILADRYLGRHYRTQPAELSDWLAQYRDLPDAPAIYALLLSKLPKGSVTPPPPEAPALPSSANDAADPRQSGLDRDPVHAGMSGRKSLAAQQRAAAAQQLFLKNDDNGALKLAQSILAAAPADARPAIAYYVGGLAAWRVGRFDIARTMFQDGAQAAATTPRLHAALAFWASRAARQARDADAAVSWLKVAAGEPTTFHGLLARRILRLDTDSIARQQILTQADINAIAALPGGQRAFALLQIGQTDRAEQELRGLWREAQENRLLARSLVMLTSFLGMGDLAAQMNDLREARDDNGPPLPHVPVPRLRPAGGFRIDPPLVYALARLESNFDPRAVSAAGARGLMQIMPETAQYVTGNVFYTAQRLHEPAANLAIGQRYLASLSEVDGIGDDLMRILASYNAGPGNVLRWMGAMHDQDDPLLFIESIPVAETRAFVPQALTYLWLYAAQMHLPSPSLDAVAAGEFPRFTPEYRERKMAVVVPPLN